MATMRPNQFFRTVWRLNGVLILLALLLAAGAAVVGLVASLVFRVGDSSTDAPAAAVEGKARLEFGTMEEVSGTPYVILPLVRREAGKGFSSGDTSETRNLLFYDTSTGATRWLRPGHGGIVLEHQFLSGRRPRGDEDGREPAPVRWIRYELADLDTDGDGEVTGRDAVRVAVSGPGGEGLTVVLGDAAAILGYAPPRDGVLLVFFRRGGKHLVAEVDLGTRTLRRTTPLPDR